TGDGARFDVVLELTKPCADPSPPRETTSRAPGELDVLLVEDHADSAEALSEFLRLHGYHVRVAASLAEARAAAKESFDVLISDVQLPDGTGVELMAELTRQGPIVGIAMSGFGSEDDVQRS